MADNLLDKASILLTPTAYDNGSMLSVKPNKNLYGSELVTNGDFSQGSQDWTFNTNGNNQWSVANEKASYLGTATDFIITNNVLTIGKKYLVSFDILDTNGSTIRLSVNSEVGGAFDNYTNGNGKYTTYLTANTNYLRIGASSSGASFSIDNVSVKEDLTGDFTFSRGGNGSRINSSGNIVTESANIPRIDYTDGCGSWLLEGQSTNLYLNSDTLATQSNATSASTYTVSFYGTGTITFSGTHTGTLVGTGANDRVSVTFTATSGTLTSTISGTCTKGQLEQQSYATSYIPTEGATNTRLQDIATNSGNSTLINSTEGVLYFEAKTDNSNTGSISINNSSSTARITARFRSDISKIQLSIIGSTNDFNFNSDVITLSDYNKIAIVYNSSGEYYFFVNGVKSSVQIKGTFTADTLNQLDFNRGGGVEPFYGKAKALAVFKEALTDAQLQSLTTI